MTCRLQVVLRRLRAVGNNLFLTSKKRPDKAGQKKPRPAMRVSTVFLTLTLFTPRLVYCIFSRLICIDSVNELPFD